MNSIPVSGILKNQTKSSSLAASCEISFKQKMEKTFFYLDGIMRKDPTNITNEGLGLNPNINVEDEYIENLLKQVHFLGLEIKLMYLFIHNIMEILLFNKKVKKNKMKKKGNWGLLVFYLKREDLLWTILLIQKANIKC